MLFDFALLSGQAAKDDAQLSRPIPEASRGRRPFRAHHGPPVRSPNYHPPSYIFCTSSELLLILDQSFDFSFHLFIYFFFVFAQQIVVGAVNSISQKAQRVRSLA